MAHIIDGPNQEFASRIIDARRKANLTQDELAEKIGINKRSISQYENGHQFPREDTIRALATALNVDPMWLATGHSEKMHQYFEDQYASRSKMQAQLDLLYIEQWARLTKGPVVGLPKYNPTPRYGLESSNLAEFVPCTKTLMDQYRAVRYPGTHPENPAFPAGSILVYDAGPISAEGIPSGSDVIFRLRGNENEPGMRRLVREPGMPEAMLVSLDPAMPCNLLPLDPVDVEILGVVIMQVINRRPAAGA